MKQTLLIITALMLVVGFTSGQEPTALIGLPYQSVVPENLMSMSSDEVHTYFQDEWENMETEMLLSFDLIPFRYHFSYRSGNMNWDVSLDLFEDNKGKAILSGYSVDPVLFANPVSSYISWDRNSDGGYTVIFHISNFLGSRRGHSFTITKDDLIKYVITDDNKSAINTKLKSGKLKYNQTNNLVIIDGKYFSVEKTGLENVSFMNALSSGRSDLISKLIQRGDNIGIIYDNGNNLLLFAAREGALPAVESLIEKGLDINWKNFDNHTALDLAIENNHNAVAIKLLELHADYDYEYAINAVIKNKNGVLFRELLLRNSEFIKELKEINKQLKVMEEITSIRDSTKNLFNKSPLKDKVVMMSTNELIRQYEAVNRLPSFVIEKVPKLIDKHSKKIRKKLNINKRLEKKLLKPISKQIIKYENLDLIKANENEVFHKIYSVANSYETEIEVVNNYFNQILDVIDTEFDNIPEYQSYKQNRLEFNKGLFIYLYKRENICSLDVFTHVMYNLGEGGSGDTDKMLTLINKFYFERQSSKKKFRHEYVKFEFFHYDESWPVKDLIEYIKLMKITTNLLSDDPMDIDLLSIIYELEPKILKRGHGYKYTNMDELSSYKERVRRKIEYKIENFRRNTIPVITGLSETSKEFLNEFAKEKLLFVEQTSAKYAVARIVGEEDKNNASAIWWNYHISFYPEANSSLTSYNIWPLKSNDKLNEIVNSYKRRIGIINNSTIVISDNIKSMLDNIFTYSFKEGIEILADELPLKLHRGFYTLYKINISKSDLLTSRHIDFLNYLIDNDTIIYDYSLAKGLSVRIEPVSETFKHPEWKYSRVYKTYVGDAFIESESERDFMQVLHDEVIFYFTYKLVTKNYNQNSAEGLLDINLLISKMQNPNQILSIKTYYKRKPPKVKYPYDYSFSLLAEITKFFVGQKSLEVKILKASNNYEALRILISNGFDPHFKSNKTNAASAMEIAKENKHTTIMNILMGN